MSQAELFPISACTHSGKTNFAMTRDSIQHEYCPKCGWHLYRGKEYTKAEWHEAFIKWDDE